jgi:hypothetical protein
MLTFDGHWHAREVCPSQVNHGFNCTGQMADNIYGMGEWFADVNVNAPWWRLGYGIGRHKLWTTNTINGNLNAQRYRDEILRPILMPFIHRHHLMFQHDDAEHLGATTAQPRSGRPDKLTERDQRVLEREFQTASGSNVSTRTVRRELHEMGFHGRAATHKPKITMRKAKFWLEWCKSHRYWTLEQWMCIFWSIESGFTI